MWLSDTTAKPFLGRPNVTFVFPTKERAYATRILIHERSKWTPSPHWHERYTEYFRVVQGRALLSIDGVTREITSADGEQIVAKFAVHEFSRADIDAADGYGDSGDVIVEERVEPGSFVPRPEGPNITLNRRLISYVADGSKEVFFRNIFSILADADRVYGRAMPIQIMITSRYLDNFDVFLPGPFSYYVTHSIFALARAIGFAMGLRPWYEEYTPERLRSVAASQGAKSVKFD